MALKNLFDMVKADRYTQDGRDELIKAQEAETEDRVYNIGEISQKTGLQKTANGWVKPKNGKQPGAKENGPLSPAKRKAERIAKMQKETGKEAPYGRTLKGTPKTPDDNLLTERTQKRAVEAKGKEVQRQMKHDDLVSRMAEEERIWNKNHPDKAHYNYNPKPTESKPGRDRDEAKAQEVKLGGGADTYYFEDPDNMSNEDKVFKSLDIELDSSFGDRNGNPDDVESWVEAWKENIRNEGGIGIKSKKTRQPAAPVPAEEALKIIEKNPARLKNLIKRAKKFYSGGTIAGGFDDWGGRAIGEDSAPRVLTGDTRIRVRK